MEVLLTTRIKAEFSKLEKKNQTAEVRKDVCDFFLRYSSISQVVNLKENLAKNNGFYRKKCDLRNSVSKQKGGGYRIYFFVD